MDRILVVGATGQLGRAAIHKLKRRPANVRALVRSAEAAAVFQSLDVESVHGDLTDRDSLSRACAGVTTVIATANAAIPTRPTDTFASVERDGYRNLIGAAKSAGVRRFIYTSALLSRYERLSPLLRFKRETERTLIASGLDHVIFRAGVFMDTAFTMMGSTIPLRGSEGATVLRPFAFANRHLARIKNNVEQKHVAMIPGSGDTRHAFICVDDVAEFLVAAAYDGPSGTHTAAGPEALTYLDVVHLYERILGATLRVQRAPAMVLRAAARLLRPFSPAGANLMALNYIAAVEDSFPDAAAAARFGVRLTSAESFLRAKTALAATL
jgi:uncharacterized protein YbjT (DUF2867 family)